jgi:hypothetical protein
MDIKQGVNDCIDQKHYLTPLSDFWPEVARVVIDYFESGIPSFDAAYKIAERIGDGYEFIKFANDFFLDCKGDWEITNADLECASMIYFLYDCNPSYRSVRAVFMPIIQAIHNKRKKQVYDDYVYHGGLLDKHVKLLSKMSCKMSLYRGGSALCSDGKRPFGNSDVIYDMLNILDVCDLNEIIDSELPIPVDAIERAWMLYDQLGFALYDVLCLVRNLDISKTKAAFSSGGPITPGTNDDVPILLSQETFFNEKMFDRWACDQSVFNRTDICCVEKHMEIACANKKCKFWSSRYEQNCSGETQNGDPAIIICTKYIPDNHRITKGLKTTRR